MSHFPPSLPLALRRRNHFDVTNRVQVADPQAVRDAIFEVFEARYPGFQRKPLNDAFAIFTRLYAGLLPGYAGCDTWYHDAQHSLDCALAMARLTDGYEKSPELHRPLGQHRAVLGVIIALFHDAGYIRRDQDTASNGAEFTLSHVGRSGEFLRDYLPGLGFGKEAELASRIVHYTGYEIALDSIDVADAEDRTLGFLLGTADVLAQTSDRCYLEKCRDFLYPEFEYCGLAGKLNPGSASYESAQDLLSKTPGFNRKLWQERLDGYFGGVHRYLDTHFGTRKGGGNPYLESIRANVERIETMIREHSFAGLTLRPKVVGAKAMQRAARRLPVSEGLMPLRLRAA